MSVPPNAVYRCTIVWHNQPDVYEDVGIYVGVEPAYLRYTPIDESIFFSMPACQCVVGYDEGEWRIIAVHEPIWQLSDLSIHQQVVGSVQAWWRNWQWKARHVPAE